MFQQWLQDVIALQCSIMRHLKKKASSSTLAEPLGASLTERLCEQRANVKPCTPPDDLKPRESLERTPSPDSCFSKPPVAHDDPRPESCAPCKCSAAPCTDCKKPNGPASEERRPPKANGPVDCKSSSDLRGQQEEPELQQRLKLSATATAAAPGLANHTGAETIKKEPQGKTEDCARTNVPAAPTIWPLGGRAEQETPKTCTGAAPKSNLGHSSVKLDTSAPAPGTPPPTQTPPVSTALLRCCSITEERNENCSQLKNKRWANTGCACP